MKKPPRPSRPSRSRTIAGLILVVALLAALAAVLGTHLAGGSAGAPPVTPTIDPRLVLHPRHVPISGTLGGSALNGNLYPGLTGPNTIELHATPPTSANHLDLVATMPGMQMVPARTRLTLRGGAYRGTVTLPMFGGYLARLSVVGSGGITGTVHLLVPLALGQ
jgi:hypothetical protein